MTMGTASTMACMTEALGLTLPGAAAIPAVDSRRSHVAEAAGRQIVALAEQVVRPSDVLTPGAFENAIRTLHAISGSTNAIIHLIAYAGRLGIDLPLSRFDELCASTPWLVDLKPAGEHLMEDFYYAGGLPAVLEQIRDLLNLDALTVTGRTLGENLDAVPTEIIEPKVIRPRSAPLDEGGSLVVLRGNLCPRGAVMKISAADRRLLAHEGRAVVFDGHRRPRRPRRRSGPRRRRRLRDGAPQRGAGRRAGHARVGPLPIPAKLLRQGVTDLLRISDARMSGTSYGAVVLHVAPESAVGGPLALVHDGDRIRLDVAARTLDLLVDDAELDAPACGRGRRRRARTRAATGAVRGHVLQANEGCDLDFLRGRSSIVTEPSPISNHGLAGGCQGDEVRAARNGRHNTPRGEPHPGERSAAAANRSSRLTLTPTWVSCALGRSASSIGTRRPPEVAQSGLRRRRRSTRALDLALRAPRVVRASRRRGLPGGAPRRLPLELVPEDLARRGRNAVALRGRNGRRGDRLAHRVPRFSSGCAAPGASSTPGFMIAAGSSSAFVARSAAMNSSGTSRRYHGR